MTGKVYLYLPTKSSWYDAREACRKWGQDLAVITTYKEFDEILPKLPRDVGEFWVGAKLEGNDVKNDWYWVSGEPLSPKFNQWYRTEPDILADDCALLRPYGDRPEYSGKLGTIECDYTGNFPLCQT